MLKKIKDYLPIYIGRDIEYYCSTNGKTSYKKLRYTNIYDITRGINQGYYNVKLILRPLSDMTEYERKEMSKQKHKFDTGNSISHAITDVAYKIEWAIKQGFDVFGLIEAGLAISYPLQSPSVAKA